MWVPEKWSIHLRLIGLERHVMFRVEMKSPLKFYCNKFTHPCWTNNFGCTWEQMLQSWCATKVLHCGSQPREKKERLSMYIFWKIERGLKEEADFRIHVRVARGRGGTAALAEESNQLSPLNSNFDAVMNFLTNPTAVDTATTGTCRRQRNIFSSTTLYDAPSRPE